MDGLSLTNNFQYSIKIIEPEPDITSTVNNKAKTSTFLLNSNLHDSFEIKHLRTNKSKFCELKQQESILNVLNYSKNLKSSLTQIKDSSLNTNTIKSEELKVNKTPKSTNLSSYNCVNNNLNSDKNHFNFILEKEQADLIIKDAIIEETDFDILFDNPLLKRVFNIKE